MIEAGALVYCNILFTHRLRRLAGDKRPKAIEVRDTLPKSTAGKILRRSVRDVIVARDRKES